VALLLSSSSVAYAQPQPEPPQPLPPEAEPPPSAAGPVPAYDDRAIRAELEAERKAREALEARVARQELEARPPVPVPSPVLVTGFAQIDWTAFRQSSQDEVSQDGRPLNEDRFLIRRARIRVERDFGLVHGLVELDANTVDGIQVRPTDAEVTFKWPASRPYTRSPWAYDPIGTRPRFTMDPPPVPQPGSREVSAPWFRVSAGLLRTPFGFEVPEWDYDRPFLERSTFANAMFPGTSDLGLGIFGGFRFVRYECALMNGDPIGERAFPGRDPSKSKDLVFRVGGASMIADGVIVEGGVSGLTGRGFHQGKAATTDVIQWQDSNGNGIVDDLNELQIIPGSPATPSADFNRFAVGADLRATIAVPFLGDLRLRGEIVRGTNLDRAIVVSDPVAAARDLRQLGWYVGAAQDITPWAQIGVRYDRYDPDADAREQEPFALVPRDLAMSTWAFTGIARVWLLRLTAQYDHRTNALGRDVNGRPTTLADDSFTLRAEVRF
jgi:hypothetical protein